MSEHSDVTDQSLGFVPKLIIVNLLHFDRISSVSMVLTSEIFRG